MHYYKQRLREFPEVNSAHMQSCWGPVGSIDFRTRGFRQDGPPALETTKRMILAKGQ